MKLDFDAYPLNIYNQPISKCVFKSIGWTINQTTDAQSVCPQDMLSSLLNKATGANLLTLIDDVSIGFLGLQARRCLADMIRLQAINISKNPSSLLEEAQFNLFAISCITEFLCSKESASWGNGIKNLGKIAIGVLSLRDPRNVIWESVMEVSKKYDNICQLYHIAFLLIVFDSRPNLGDFIKKLIVESLSEDSNKDVSILTKQRPLLFSGLTYKTLKDNIKNRAYFIRNEATKYEELYDPFVKWRMDNPL